MKVYIKRHQFSAGKWIYEGYARAWESLGYNVGWYDELIDIKEKDYYLMAMDHDVSWWRYRGFNDGNHAYHPMGEPHPKSFDILENAKKTFLFVQPWIMREPWASHVNFITGLNLNEIDKINSMNNVIKWTFSNPSMYNFYDEWKSKIHVVNLAFDSLLYTPIIDKEYEFDVCYIGSWANNAYDEKKKIMIDYFKEIKKLDIKAGIFICKNISVQDEIKLLYNSKTTINIHDKYQRVLGCDTNERTFKALGLNGFLISDKATAVNSIFPNVQMADSPEHMATLIKESLNKDLTGVKEENRKHILKSHTYIERVKQMLSL